MTGEAFWRSLLKQQQELLQALLQSALLHPTAQEFSLLQAQDLAIELLCVVEKHVQLIQILFGCLGNPLFLQNCT